jgi:tectonic-1/3
MLISCYGSCVVTLSFSRNVHHCCCLAVVQVVLGIWGNADSSRVNQWVPVQSSGWPAGTDLDWDEATATCSNVITGFDINIVTGIAFASGNLQSKVLYAQVCFSVGSWSFNQMAGQSLQVFPLQFTASFVPKQQQQPVLSLKPAPPLFAPLPPDLFYPFLTSRAEIGGQPLSVLVLLAASMALQLLFAGPM